MSKTFRRQQRRFDDDFDVYDNDRNFKNRRKDQEQSRQKKTTRDQMLDRLIYDNDE
jgi:hypothetical protein